jgi:hypothetical protein
MTSLANTAENLLRRFHQIGDGALAGVNLALGGLVTVANGSALILTLGGTDPALATRVWQMATLAVAGGALFLLSLLVFFLRAAATAILRLQVVVLFGLTVALILLGFDLAVHVSELANRAVWQFGLLTLLGGYTGALVTRSFMATWPLSKQALAFVIWLATLIALDFSIAVRVGF